MANHAGSSGSTQLSTLKKFTIIGLCLIIFQLNVAATSAQMISLSITKGTISDVFKAIENQSDYKFFYNDNQIDVNDKVDIKVQESPIENVLNDMFRDTDITYKIVKNHVVLTNKKIKEAPVESVNQDKKE